MLIADYQGRKIFRRKKLHKCTFCAINYFTEALQWEIWYSHCALNKLLYTVICN